MATEKKASYSIEAKSTIRQPTEINVKKHYEYVVAIDFGTYSSSFSYARTKGETDIITVDTWSKTNRDDFGGRVLTSSIYQKDSNGPFLWGGSASRKYYNRSRHYYYIPNIKLYLTEPNNQVPLPEGLDPIKITSDYLRELHSYGLKHMQSHFETKNAIKSNTRNDNEFAEDDFNKPEKSATKKNELPTVLPSQIRYIISYPDNEDKIYQNCLKNALIKAEIISEDDPDDRLTFIKESAAVANYCIQQNLPGLKPSRKPYLICDVGSKVFGLSSVMIDELVDTGKIKSHSNSAINKWGTLELDKNMKRYLKKRFQFSPDFTPKQINTTIDRLFEYYLDDIKFAFESGAKEEDSDISIDMTTIISGNYAEFSDPIRDGIFIIPYEDLKKEVFDPVTGGIVNSIRLAKTDLDGELGGIFFSGRIGQDDNLQKILENTFGTAEVKIISIKNVFSVSEGAVSFGLRKRGLQLPYFLSDSQEKTQRILKQGNESSTGEVFHNSDDIIIDSGDSDYVVGLDFGTTFSGFAYASVSEYKENKSHFQIIKEVHTWPKQKGNNLSKAPSLLLYDDKLNYKGKFGEEAKQIYNRGTGKDILLRNFKLLLSRYFNREEDDRSLKKLEDFQLVDAIANYLKDFHKAGLADMHDKVNKRIDKSRIRYVVTVPAMWSDEAKNTMREAVTRAALVKKDDIKKRVKLITEPEAAALYCEEVLGHQFKMDVEQRFMICDAGGGTVDLVTFKVGQDTNDSNQRVISEVTSGIGGNCGSSYLDEAFENYVVDKLKEAGITIVQKAIDEIVEKFSKDIKPNFESSNQPENEEIDPISLPASLNIPSEVSEDIIDNGDLILSYFEIEKYVFKPVIDEILDLIEKQLGKLSENERQLDAILLVGGFGQSSYLLDKIRKRFGNQKVGAKFIGCPPNGDMAVSKGAVSFGLKPRMVSESVTRYTYGLQVSKKKDDTLYDPDLRFRGFNNEIYYRNVFSKIIGKASRLNKGDLFIKRVFVEYPNDAVFALYSTESDDDPKSVADMEPIYKVTLTMPELEGKTEGEKIEFEVCVAIYGTDIELKIRHDGVVLDKGVITEKSIITLKYASRKSSKKKLKILLSPKIFLKKN